MGTPEEGVGFAYYERYDRDEAEIMHRNEHSVEIERPAAAVFPYLTVGEKLLQWVGGSSSPQR